DNESYGRFSAYPGQVFYNVSFENTNLDRPYIIRGYSSLNSDNPITFNKVEFFGDGKIEGYNEFDTLILHGGKTFQFEAGKSQTITSNFEMHTADCAGWSVLKSTTEGEDAIVSA